MAPFSSRICIKTELKIQSVMVLNAFQGKSLQLATVTSAFPYFNKRRASSAIIGCTLKKIWSGTQNPGWMLENRMVLGKTRRVGKAPVEQVAERLRTVRAGGAWNSVGESWNQREQRYLCGFQAHCCFLVGRNQPLPIMCVDTGTTMQAPPDLSSLRGVASGE